MKNLFLSALMFSLFTGCNDVQNVQQNIQDDVIAYEEQYVKQPPQVIFYGKYGKKKPKVVFHGKYGFNNIQQKPTQELYEVRVARAYGISKKSASRILTALKAIEWGDLATVEKMGIDLKAWERFQTNGQWQATDLAQIGNSLGLSPSKTEELSEVIFR